MKKLTMLVAAAFAMTSAMAQLNPMEPIPADKDVRTGKLENGMTYYIRHNEKPKGQADFHILHDVGAIQENDAQQGLAHFLEHMAFNGTKNLPGKQMIEYLEKVGVKFGANLNAGTSWDMTSYMMKDVPTSREGIIDSALLILHDWSHFIALQPEEIDSERGVIMEELRTRDNASWRSTMKMLQALGKGTKYEHRNLIGYLDGLKGFQHKELEDFYNTWYRPDYQAVVIVGDIDVDAVENKLKTLMSDIPAPAADAAQKEVITVPDNEEPIVSIYTDPEMQGSRVQVFVKRPAVPEQYNNLVYGEMLDVVQAYMTTMENARLQEISMQPDAPFLGAGMNSGSIGVIPTLEATTFHPASTGYFRGGGFSSHFVTRAEMPATMIRLNLVKGLGPVLQIAEGWTVKLPDEVTDTLMERTNPTWPCTWFTPRCDGKSGSPFESAYSVMQNWGANHGAISYGHVGADLITLCSMLRIPVCMHNVADKDVFRPAAWNAFGMDKEGQDYRACAAYGPMYKNIR